ncbi:hypothetical protein [Bacillus cereus]|uniref:hypothetical protein n=1 Tax=Bacillus cereus TaxID=1396 RepID=UPI00380CB47B
MEWKDGFEVIKVIIPALTAIGGVYLGGKFTRENNIKIQKKFTLQKFRIEKSQEINNQLTEYAEEFWMLKMEIHRYQKGLLDIEGIRNEFTTRQRILNEKRRLLIVNYPFYKDYQTALKNLNVANLILMEETHKLLFLIEEPSQSEFEKLTKNMDKWLNTVYEMTDKFVAIIEKELEYLEDGLK